MAQQAETGQGNGMRCNSHSRPLSTSLDQSGNDQLGVSIVDTENEDLHGLSPNLHLNMNQGQGHKLNHSDTLNTLSSRTPTITHSLLMNNGAYRDSFFNFGCNIDD